MRKTSSFYNNTYLIILSVNVLLHVYFWNSGFLKKLSFYTRCKMNLSIVFGIDMLNYYEKKKFVVVERSTTIFIMFFSLASSSIIDIVSKG